MGLETEPKRSRSGQQAVESGIQSRIDERLEGAGARLLSLRKANGSWDFYASLGQHFLSQYWLCLRWLGVDEPRLSGAAIESRLRKTQLADGSWRQLEDKIASPGDLNATVFNYWFLKAWLRGATDPALERARAFILAEGGIEASSLFTRTFLALFGEYPWRKLARVPYALFLERSPINYRSFSQWVIPHLMPIAYLRANRVTRSLGPDYSVAELWRSGVPRESGRPSSAADPIFDRFLIEKMLDHQQPKGSWGGYTVSTLLTAMSLRHCAESRFAPRPRLEAAASRGLEFVAGLYVNGGPGAYEGCLMDGHVWDTLLAANALRDAGAPELSLAATSEYLRALQQTGGGFPYGYDFEYAPDVDDTAEAILFFSGSSRQDDTERVARAVRWLLSLQNSDGGWGAFDRNNIGDPLLRRLARPFNDSVDLFDDSSADSTGHVLDALASTGLTLKNSAEIRRAVAYLRRTQSETLGAWEGRWAINWIFGTTCALVGLVRAGVSVEDPCVTRGFRFLLERQNTDGGFGETAASYRDVAIAGRGPSSPSQTAWVLWALCAGARGHGSEARRAAEFLLQSYEPAQGWSDPFATGTGHPGLLYMRYPSYAAAFPLQALARYRKELK